MTKRILLFFLLFLTLLSASFAQEILDRIVAVVGDKIILQSELDFQFQLYIAQMGKRSTSQKELDELKRGLLDQMINDKLILNQAEKDTLLQVTSKEISDALERHLNEIKSQFPSQEVFQRELEAEGLTEKELRKRYKEQAKNELLMNRLISSKLAKVSVSSHEVKGFFELYQDSLPDQPEAANVSHILLQVKPGENALDSLRGKAYSILARAETGEEFSELARRYSEDPTKERGGDLGFFEKGDLLPEFEKEVFSLIPGQMKVVKTSLGYHIVKMEEKRGESVHARHILLKIEPSREDSNLVRQRADSLYLLLKEGGDFGELAKMFSDDEESKKLGGDLGWYPVEELPEELKTAVRNLAIGEISEPTLSEYGWHILIVKEKKEKRKLNLEDDWDAIKDMAKRTKTKQKVEEWVQKLRDETYVEVRL
jgi:peptidyl-prolyl cis-trans isomerase SurA